MSKDAVLAILKSCHSLMSELQEVAGKHSSAIIFAVDSYFNLGGEDKGPADKPTIN